eukprot:124003-Chlamydomonas_euryale.AAC.5
MGMLLPLTHAPACPTQILVAGYQGGEIASGEAGYATMPGIRTVRRCTTPFQNCYASAGSTRVRVWCFGLLVYMQMHMCLKCDSASCPAFQQRKTYKERAQLGQACYTWQAVGDQVVWAACGPNSTQ